MEYFQLIRSRHSIRVFEDRAVAEDKLRSILEAANAAPSAGNLQAYEIHVVSDVRRRAALARAAGAQGFVLGAPVSLVFCANPRRNEPHYGERGRDLYSVQDATIAAAFAMLAAVDLGLATTWTGAFDTAAVREVIGVSASQTPVVILPIGYAGAPPELRGRRSLEDLVKRL